MKSTKNGVSFGTPFESQNLAKAQIASCFAMIIDPTQAKRHKLGQDGPVPTGTRSGSEKVPMPTGISSTKEPMPTGISSAVTWILIIR